MIGQSNRDNSLLYIKTILTSLTILLNICSNVVQSGQDGVATSPAETKACSIVQNLGANELTPINVVVENPIKNLKCIKAFFLLAIKVEGEMPVVENISNAIIPLGHVDLGAVLNVQESCPESISVPDKAPPSGATEKPAELEQQVEEEQMIVKFECGELTFVFKRDNYFHLSAIRGVVNLDAANTVEDFVVEQPMFFSDLNHHFKFDELIEVKSTVKSKNFILSALFYQSEFEVFRNTNSRDFIRMPDSNSTAFA